MSHQNLMSGYIGATFAALWTVFLWLKRRRTDRIAASKEAACSSAKLTSTTTTP